MAKAAAGECQQVVIRNGIQLFGGIGFTWENDLQISVRRAALGEVLLGGAVSHRRRVATTFRSCPPSRCRRCSTTSAPSSPRWLDDHLPPLEDDHDAFALLGRRTAVGGEFQRAMFDAGWLLPGHPPEFGGRNAPLLAQFAIQAELYTRGVSELQSAGTRHHRAVDPDVRHRGTEAALGGADPARRDHRRARDERTERRQRPCRSPDPRPARRRPLHRQRAEGVDVGRARR